jgi:hypothetical protein
MEAFRLFLVFLVLLLWAVVTFVMAISIIGLFFLLIDNDYDGTWMAIGRSLGCKLIDE